MIIDYKTIDSRHYVMNPSTKRVGEKRFIHFDILNCPYILLVTDPAVKEKNLFSNQKFQDCLRELAIQNETDFCSMKDTALPGVNLRVTCINYLKYQLNNKSTEIPDQVARIHVCGMAVQDDRATVYVPNTEMRSFVDILLEMRYKCKEHVVQVNSSGSGYFKKQQVSNIQNSFYRVEFEPLSMYTNGSVCYEVSVRGNKYEIPITREMLGKPMLIKKPSEGDIVFKGNGVSLHLVEEFK